MRRVRRNPSSACSGFATAIASSSLAKARSSPEANESRLTSRRPARTKTSRSRSRNAYDGGTPPACPADGTVAADAVVAVDPGDLFDQVDLALDVDAVAGHLDLDRVVVAASDAHPRAGRRPGARRSP